MLAARLHQPTVSALRVPQSLNPSSSRVARMVVVVTLALVLARQSASAQQQGGPVPTPEAVSADTGVMRHANKRTPPLAYATRVTAGSPGIHVDARLDEAVWSKARGTTVFSQAAPREGEPATEQTDVRIVYDDNAVYIGAR